MGQEELIYNKVMQKIKIGDKFTLDSSDEYTNLSMKQWDSQKKQVISEIEDQMIAILDKAEPKPVIKEKAPKASKQYKEPKQTNKR